jgi:formate dehydrogenase maturation protein FdhE
MIDTASVSCICDVCDCAASPDVSLIIHRRNGYGFRHLTVCIDCLEEYEHGRIVECANCGAKVPADSEWSSYSYEAGESFCFLCSGRRGY